MRITNFSNKARRRIVVAAACLGAAGAVAMPGVAWAQNAIPGGAPVVVGTPTAEVAPAVQTASGENCALSVKPLTDEELQKLIDEGVVTMATEAVPATVTEGVVTDVTAPEGEPQVGSLEITDSIKASAVTVSAC
ncbi:hypothetical protein [Prescottella agglutinans]|uniref:hypothetical protein n=1 Tax=Prescottella agglutinans TaxID=1644129 RepID=UPI003D99B9DA